MHVVEDLILCMAVPSAGDTCNLQIEQAKCIRWEQLLFPQVRHLVSPLLSEDRTKPYIWPDPLVVLQNCHSASC